MGKSASKKSTEKQLRAAEKAQGISEIAYSRMHFGKEVGEWRDPYDYVFHLGAMCVGAAVDFRKRSNSYRGFRVGSAILAADKKATELYGFAAANSKLTQDAQRRCAEIKLIEYARERELTFLPAVFVAGTDDVDKIKEVNHFEAPTLYPCMRSCLPALSPESIIISVGVDTKKDTVTTLEAHTTSMVWEQFDGVGAEATHSVITEVTPELFNQAHMAYLDLTSDLRQSHAGYEIRGRIGHELGTRLIRARAAVEAIRLTGSSQ